MTQPVLLSVTGFSADESRVAALIDQLWLLGTTGVEERAGELIAGFDSQANADAAAAHLPGGLKTSVADVPALSSWDTFAEVTIEGRFVIRPPWLDSPPAADLPADAIELVIDPGATFGHGGHPSTRLALRALASQIKPGDTVLDVGCGSGVLAIAAQRLGANVEAFDIDPEATAATIANAATNDVIVDARTHGIDDLPAGTQWDVVVANMARPLLAEYVQPLLAATRRTLILSGMLDDQEVPQAAGERLAIDGWGCDIVAGPG